MMWSRTSKFGQNHCHEPDPGVLAEETAFHLSDVANTSRRMSWARLHLGFCWADSHGYGMQTIRMAKPLSSNRLLAASIVLALSTALRAVAGQSATCTAALRASTVCDSANVVADSIMGARHLVATTLVQDVKSGALIVFAASRPSRLDVTTPVLPLSVSKLFLAASWWDHHLPDRSFATKNRPGHPNPAFGPRVTVREMLIGGSDTAGKQIAVVLRHALGTEAVLADLARYGFPGRAGSFWAAVDPEWTARLTPQPATVSLESADDEEWAAALSVGERDLAVTPLSVSRFLQAVGNYGVECGPIAARSATVAPRSRVHRCETPRRVLQVATARQLMAAMLGVVQRGTATGIAQVLSGTGWRIGGKTGTGGRPQMPFDQQDGWFAGLAFAPDGRARFTAVTFVERAGAGGGNAAEVSATIVRLLIEHGA